jgi:uncharacterized damage-inducible protein DinB
MTLSLFRELHAHQAWADAEHWRFILAEPAAIGDGEVRDRLHHLHVVQQAFLRILKREELDLPALLKTPSTVHDLLDPVKQYHSTVSTYLENLVQDDLDRRLDVPWFEGGFQPTVAEALLQVPMHSQYHRGQNAMRVRQLGGKPVDTDYIEWVMKGRPDPQWP